MINLSGRPNKFYADDRFGKTIIKLNKKKIRPSANLKINKFLREVIVSNVLALGKSKDVMARMIRATRHGNRHSVVETYNDVTFVVKLFVAEKTFEETLGYGSGDNGKSTNIDLFGKGTAALVRGIPLQNYICRARGNWTQAGTQAAEGDREIKQDLFDENLDNLIERMSVQDDDDE